MAKISPKLESLLYMAVKTTGTYDPDEVLPYIEEKLTLKECRQVEAFLMWCMDTGTTFGWNLPTIWEKWQGTPHEKT